MTDDRIVPELVGYADRLDVSPGEEISFMVSSDHARYDVDVVRLIAKARVASATGRLGRSGASGGSGTISIAARAGAEVDRYFEGKIELPLVAGVALRLDELEALASTIRYASVCGSEEASSRVCGGASRSGRWRASRPARASSTPARAARTRRS